MPANINSIVILSTFCFYCRNSIYDKEDFLKTLITFKRIEAKAVKENKNNPRKGDQPFSAVLAQNGWVPDTILKMTVQRQLYVIRPALLSTRHYSGQPKVVDIITDPRGFAGIIDHLAQNFTDKIKTNKVVKRIKYSSKGIEVRTKDGGKYKAKYALCTFSTGVLASDLVEFVPELPKWKREAISRLPLDYYTNIYVKFPTAFWEDNELIFVNAGSISETFPFIYNYNKKGIHEGSNILLFTATEDTSLRIETQSKNETKAEIMATLKEMYPNVSIPEPTGTVTFRDRLFEACLAYGLLVYEQPN
jgi:polyamine oxidase